jgi:hypothetical protein
MSEDRRPIVIVPEEHPKTQDGIAKVFGYIAVAVFVIAVIDHALTSVWMSVAPWFD